MGVLPYPGGILLYLSILLVCRVGGHCTGATLPPKTQKNLPDAGGTVIKEAVLSR